MSAAELDALASEAERGAPAAGEGGASPATPATTPQEPPKLSNFQAIGMGLAMSREAMCIALKVQSPKATMADERIGPIAEAWARVCDERGIDLGAFIGGNLGAALALSVPLAFAVYKGLSDELTARRAAAGETKPEAAPAPPAAPGDGG